MKLNTFTISILLCFLSLSGIAQSNKNLNVHFYEQPALFFKTEKASEYGGVEAEILKEFFKWCETKKKIKVTVKYFGYKSFNDFYESLKAAPANTIGAGTVTISEERKKQFDFSAPYLKNVAVFVSHGSVATLGADDESKLTSSKLTALVEKGSVHAEYMEKLQKDRFPRLQIKAVNEKLQDLLESNPNFVAYMDIIAYRELIKNSETYFKIHRELNVTGENFGFVLPKDSEWTPLINEFMESGFGFTSTKKYQQILESYLGYEVIRTVEIY